jgi:ribonucleotide reductase beta subunit family protein with ferritin-like domain
MSTDALALATFGPALDGVVRASAARVAKILEVRGEPPWSAPAPAEPAPGAPAPGAPRPSPRAPPDASAPSAFRWVAGEEARVSLNPVRHADIWAFRKKIEALHWIAQEIDLSRDRTDWETRMDDDQRHFVKRQLGFFARSDIDVLDNLDRNFGEEVDCLEAQMVYAAQKDQECAHTESYNLQIEAVLSGPERQDALHAAHTMPAVAAMRAWVLRWFDRALPVGDRLVAFAAVEGVLFSSGFSALQWLRELNLLPGITLANQFIVRDEGIHTLFACLLVRTYLAVRPSQARIEAIFREAVGVVDGLTEESLPVGLIGMNSGLMKQYVRYQADCVVSDMGYQPIFEETNPFAWMDKLSLNEVAKSNFFEKQVSQYQGVTKAGASQLALDESPIEW